MYTHDGIKVMWVETWQWNGHLENQRSIYPHVYSRRNQGHVGRNVAAEWTFRERDMVYLHMYTHDGIKVMWVDTWQWNGHLKNQGEKRIQLLGYDKIAWQRPSNDH